MESKRIDENTIQVLINQDDLIQRGISIPDLMNNQDKIETFFYQILDEVDVDHDFDHDSALTFQARPMRNNGLELLIKRVNQEGDVDLPQAIKDQLQGYDENQSLDEQQDDVEVALADPTVDKYEQVVKLGNFEDLVELAQQLYTLNLVTDLYRFEGDYYLVLTFMNDGTLTAGEIRDRMAVVNEFAQPANISKIFLAEHGKQIMDQTAIELVRHYFN